MSVRFAEWMCDNAESIAEEWNINLPENEWVDSVYDIDDDEWLIVTYQEWNSE